MRNFNLFLFISTFLIAGCGIENDTYRTAVKYDEAGYVESAIVRDKNDKLICTDRYEYDATKKLRTIQRFKNDELYLVMEFTYTISGRPTGTKVTYPDGSPASSSKWMEYKQRTEE